MSKPVQGRRHGVMAVALERPAPRGVMSPAEVVGEHRTLFSIDPAAFESFDLHVEVKRLLWSAVFTLAVILWLAHVAGAVR